MRGMEDLVEAPTPAPTVDATRPSQRWGWQVMEEAIAEAPDMDPMVMHERVKGMYSWHDVACRTEVGVYNHIRARPRPSFLERIEACNQGGKRAPHIDLRDMYTTAVDSLAGPSLPAPYRETRMRSSRGCVGVDRGMGGKAVLRRDRVGYAGLLFTHLDMAGAHH